MRRERFTQKQNPVYIVEFTTKDYIFICLNETEGDETETVPSMEGDEEGEEVTVHYYEYDYAELIVNHGELNLDDVEENPEKYINYTAPSEGEISEAERITNLELQIQALTQAIGRGLNE